MVKKGTVLGIALALVNAGHAQDQTPVNEAGPKKRSSIVEEVLVTATKREADLRDIPLSIDAFTGDALRDIGADSVESIARFSSGVSVSPGLDPEAAQVIIRGVSTDTFFTFFTRTFGLFYEDVSLVNPSILGPQPNVDPFDMRTVEILKGPQGTLFGGSALAGAIRYVPNKPDMEDSYGKIAAQVGDHARSESQSHRYDLMWNQPLTDNLGVRVVGSKSDRPGYVKDLRSGKDDINSSDASQFRGIVTWDASDSLSFTLNYFRRDTHQDDGAFANNDQRPEHSERYFPDVVDSTTEILVGSVDWALEPFSIKAIVSNMDKEYPQRLDYSQFIGTSTVGLGLYGDTFIESSQPTAELRLVSNEPTESDWWIFDGWSYVAGYFYVFSDQFLELNLGTAQTGNLLQIQGNVDAKENALFFDLTRTLGERWEFGFGGRYFKQSTEAVMTTGVTAVDSLVTGSPLDILEPILTSLPVGTEVELSRRDGKISETVFNPKFTLQWRFTDQVSFFTSAVRGFRYAGANQNPTLDPNVPLFFESDDIWNYEIGTRTEWFDGALQLDLTAFLLKWTDLQVQQRDYTGAFAYTDNVGGAENKGLEFAMNMLLPGGFATKLNLSYVDARTTTFFDDFQGPAPEGTELPGTSPFSGSLLLLWMGETGPAQTTATLSYTYQNRNYNNLPHTYEHPALGLLGASVNMRFYKLPGEPAISLVGNNLTNEFEPGVVFDTPNTGGILTIFNPPRSVTLGVEFSL